MFIKFSCVHCGHRLKIHADQAGKHCKCSRCGLAMAVPVPRRGWFFLALGACAGLVLGGAVLLALFLYGRAHELDQKLTDLGGDVAPMNVVDGAKTEVELATLGDDGPTGGFFHMGKEIPW